MPVLCYAERIFTNVNIFFYCSLFLGWDLVISSHFSLRYFDVLTRWVLSSPLFCCRKRNKLLPLTTLPLRRHKSIYSRKSDEPFQIIILLAVLATVFWPFLSKVSHLHLYLSTKAAVELTSRVNKFPEAAKMNRPLWLQKEFEMLKMLAHPTSDLMITVVMVLKTYCVPVVPLMHFRHLTPAFSLARLAPIWAHSLGEGC